MRKLRQEFIMVPNKIIRDMDFDLCINPGELRV